MKCFWKSSFISGDFLTGAFYSVHIALYMEWGALDFDYFIGKSKTKSWYILGNGM